MAEQNIGRDRETLNHRVVVLMSKKEKKDLVDACIVLGDHLKKRISMCDVMRYATFQVYLPQALRKVKPS